MTDLVVNDTVATRRRDTERYGIEINAVGLQIEVFLTCRRCPFVTLTDRYLNAREWHILYRQLQTVELFDKMICIKYRIIVKTRSAELVLVQPHVGRRVGNADRIVIMLLGYYMQPVDVLTESGRVRFTLLIRPGLQRLNSRVAPTDRLAYVDNNVLLRDSRRRNGHVYINDAVAYAVLGLNRDSVIINSIRLTDDIAIHLTAYIARSTGTDLVIFMCFRLGVNGQVQSVDAVGLVNGLVAVFVLLGLTDRVL